MNMKTMKKEKGNGCAAKTMHWRQSPALWHIKTILTPFLLDYAENQEDKYDWN